MAAPSARGVFATHNAKTLSSLIWDPVTASGAEWSTLAKIVEKANVSGSFSNPCGKSPLAADYAAPSSFNIGPRVILSTLYVGSLVYDWTLQNLDFAAGVYVNLCWMMVEHESVRIWDHECVAVYQALQSKINPSKLEENPVIPSKNTTQNSAYQTLLAGATMADWTSGPEAVIDPIITAFFSGVTPAQAQKDLIKLFANLQPGILASACMVPFRLLSKSATNYATKTMNPAFVSLMSELTLPEHRATSGGAGKMAALLLRRVHQIVVMTVVVEKVAGGKSQWISRLYSVRLSFHAMGVIKILLNLAKSSFDIMVLCDIISNKSNIGAVNRLAASYLVYAANWPSNNTTKDLLTSDCEATTHVDRIAGRYSRLIDPGYLSWTSSRGSVKLGSLLVGFSMAATSQSGDPPTWFDRRTVEDGKLLYSYWATDVSTIPDGTSEAMAAVYKMREKGQEVTEIRSAPVPHPTAARPKESAPTAGSSSGVAAGFFKRP